MRWKSSLAATFLGLVAASVAAAALAFDFGVANAVSSGNLSVYLVRGADAASAPLTLEQGLAGGLLKIHDGGKLPIMAENVSSRSVFIQAGDMLKGGLQDQVAAFDYVIGPHSGRVPIETLCVDPFRSAARTGDSATAFATAGGLIPSRVATLALLAQPASDKAVQKLRQSAVWWSIDSVRSALSQRLGHTLETPRRVRWDESQTDNAWVRALTQSQRSHWKTSLPLALEDPGLARAERPYLEALLAAGHRSGVIGAVFAINGRLEGAEIYRSGGLFRAMWPNLLRAYAIRALVAGPDEHAAQPSVADVTAFLDAAEAGQLRAGASQEELRIRASGSLIGMFLTAADAPSEGVRIRDSAGSIATETAGANGAWVHRSYVAKLAVAEAARSPEAALVAALDRGEIEGYPVTSLDPREPVMPQIDTSRDTPLASARDASWRVALPDSTRQAMRALAAVGQRTALDDGTAARIRLIAAIMAALVATFVAVLLLRRAHVPAKWTPVRRQEHAQMKESRACSDSKGTEHARANPLPKISGGARRLIGFARRLSACIARWTRSAVAPLRRVDRGAGMRADVSTPALRWSVARLADRRRLSRNLVRSRDLAPRTSVGGRMTSDLAA